MKKSNSILPMAITLFLQFIFAISVHANDLTISFSGMGNATTVDSVIVQNLTKDTTVVVPSGSDLQLLDVTDISLPLADQQFIQISPNPVSSQSLVSFYAKQSGIVQIYISGLDGRLLVSQSRFLQKGNNSFLLSLSTGVYFIKVMGIDYSYASKIISQVNNRVKPMLSYISNNNSETTSQPLKIKNSGAINIPYSIGDKLVFKGYSGNYITIFNDSPISSKTINFEFRPTVYSEILQNSNYHFLNMAFNEYFNTTLKEALSEYKMNDTSGENYTVLLPSDSLFEADGFSYSKANGFTNIHSGDSTGDFNANSRMVRLIKSHIFKRIKNDEVNCAITSFHTDSSFASAYNGWSYAVNDYGDMIRFKDGKIQMIGNYDENDSVTATPDKTFPNGQVFTINKLLQYSRRDAYPNQPEGYKSQDLATYILNMASAVQNPDVGIFKNYLLTCLKMVGSNVFADIPDDANITIFMPNNAAIANAVANGDLPAYTLLTSGDATAIQQATNFVLYQIVKGKQIVDDGLSFFIQNDTTSNEVVMPTLFKDVVNKTYLSIRKDNNGEMTVSTESENGEKFSAVTKTASVVRGIKHSNYFGTRAVLHEINNYLYYKRPDSVSFGGGQAVYWEITDQPEIKNWSLYRKPGSSYTFYPGELSDLKFGGINNPYISYRVDDWSPKSQYVHGDYLEIPLRPTVIQWMEIKTPVLKKGVYNVWLCWRRGGGNTKFKTIFKQEGKEDQVLQNVFDLGEYFNTTATPEENLKAGMKQYTAKQKNAVMDSHLIGSIRVDSTGRHTLRFEALSGNSQPAWWDMIEFIPYDQNQLWPRFDAAGNAIDSCTYCEDIYPYDQPCVGDLCNNMNSDSDTIAHGEPVYWEPTDQPEIKKLSEYQQPDSSVSFKSSDLSEINFGGPIDTTITYKVDQWGPKSQYIHGDYFEIPLNTDMIQWIDFKTPELKKGEYHVWLCWRRGGMGNKVQATFKQPGKEDQVLQNVIDLGEFFNIYNTPEENLANGWKQYTAKQINTVMNSRDMGTIKVDSTGHYTLRIDALTHANNVPTWIDMIEFIPTNHSQKWPRFDAAGNAIYKCTPCEDIYPYDQSCTGDLCN